MDTLRAVIADVKWFLLLLVLTVWGFTCSFYILFRRDQQYEVCQRHAHPSCTLSVPSGPCCHVLWGRLEGTVAMLLSCLRRHMVLTQMFGGGCLLQAVPLCMELLCAAACSTLPQIAMY